MMYDGQWGMGSCGGGMFMLVFWGVIILLVVFLARHFVTRNGAQNLKDSPMEILKKRYAKGELSQEEYDRMRRDLEN